MTAQTEELNPQFKWILAGLEKLTKNINDIEESSYNATVINQLKIESNLLNIAAKSVFQSHLNIVEVQQDAESKSEKTVDELLKDFEF